MAIALSPLQPIEMCADDWPQWRGPNRDGVWRESGIFDAIPARKAGSPIFYIPGPFAKVICIAHPELSGGTPPRR